MLIALCFAELAALFPKSGALVHMSHASHGEGLGRVWAWMLFLAYVAVPSVEAEAVVTYANNYLPYFLQPHRSGLLTVAGFFVCAVLLLIFAWLNLLAVRMLLTVNSAVTWWKIAVPVRDASSPSCWRARTGTSGAPIPKATASTASSPPCRPRGSCSATSASAPPSTSAAKAPIPAATFRSRSSARC